MMERTTIIQLKSNSINIAIKKKKLNKKNKMKLLKPAAIHKSHIK